MGIMQGLKKKLAEQASELKERRDYEKELKKQEREIYRSERLEQAKAIGKARAKAEAESKIAAIRQQYKAPSMKGGNIAKGLYGATQGALGFVTGGMPGFGLQQPPQKKKVVYRSKGKKRKKVRVMAKVPQQPQMQGYNWF